MGDGLFPAGTVHVGRFAYRVLCTLFTHILGWDHNLITKEQ